MNLDITIPAQSVTIPSQDVTATVPAAQIVYQNSWLRQTGAISDTNIFSLPATGLYRMTIGGTADNTPGPPYNGISATPRAETSITNATVALANLLRSGMNYDQNELSFYGISGESVVFSAFISGSGSVIFDTYLAIEQLQ